MPTCSQSRFPVLTAMLDIVFNSFPSFLISMTNVRNESIFNDVNRTNFLRLGVHLGEVVEKSSEYFHTSGSNAVRAALK